VLMMRPRHTIGLLIFITVGRVNSFMLHLRNGVRPALSQPIPSCLKS